MPKTKKGKKAMKETKKDETKRERFVRLATQRVNNAINKIRLIPKLANKNAYEFTEKDVNKIEQVLMSEVENAVKQFASAGPVKTGFALEDKV